VYQIDQNGKVEKIYIIPVDKIVYYESIYDKTNPVSFITEYNNRKYILSQWYLYILKNDEIVKSLKCENGVFKWFKNGFIHLGNKHINLYNIDGVSKGSLTFKSFISNVSFNDNIFLVETKSKAFTFKLN